MCTIVVNMNERATAVREVLRSLQPAMTADGGGVELVSVDAGIVTVRFTGACLLCPSIDLTLRLGVTRTLKEKLEWITEVQRKYD